MEAVSARRPGAPGLALPRRRAASLAVPAALCLLAGALRFWGLGRQGFWYDEATTAWLLRGNPAELLARLPHTESTPPLYYLLAWVWVRVFGDGEVGLRSISALAGVAAVPVTFLAGRELVGRRAAVFAGLLVAVNPLLVWYSQEARAYSLLVLAGALSLWLLARARADPTPGWLVGWGVVSAAALCVHYFAGFLVLPEAALLLAARGPRRRRLAAVCIPAVTAAALAAFADAQSRRVYRFTQIPLGTRVRQVVQYFVVGFSPPSGVAVFVVAGLALAGALALLAFCWARVERRGVAVAAAVGGTAVLAPIGLAVLGIDYLNARNVIGALVPLAIVVGAGLGASRFTVAPVALAGVVVAVSIAMLFGVETDVYAQRPRWQEVAEALAYRGSPRAIVLLRGHTWSRPIAFYLPRTWWPPPDGKPVEEIDVLRKVPHTGPCPVGVWWGALCNVGSHPRLKRSPAAGFRFVSTERVAGFAIDHYRARQPIRLYANWPFETRHGGSKRTRMLMVTPTRAPKLP